MTVQTLKAKNQVLSLPIVLIFLFFPFLILAEEKLEKSGFFTENIWYSKIPIFAGEKIRIYSAIFNSSKEDIVGTIEFYDNGDLIDKTDFSVVGGGKIIEIWVDWIAIYGEHLISAKIKKAEIVLIGGKRKPVNLEYDKSTESRIFIDYPADSNSKKIEDKDNEKGSSEKATILSQGLDSKKEDSLELKKELFERKEFPWIKEVFEKIKKGIEKKKEISQIKEIPEKIKKIIERTEEKLEIKKEEIKKEIEKIKEKEEKSQSYWKYPYFYLLSFLTLIFSHKILLFLIFSLVIFIIFKIAAKFVFR